MSSHCFCNAGELFYKLHKYLPIFFSMKAKQAFCVWLYTVYSTKWSSLRLFSCRLYTQASITPHFQSGLQQKLVHTLAKHLQIKWQSKEISEKIKIYILIKIQTYNFTETCKMVQTIVHNGHLHIQEPLSIQSQWFTEKINYKLYQ